MNDFIKAIGARPREREIMVYFKMNPAPVIYTMAIFDLLKTDSEVIDIIDAQTGEVIYTA